MELVVLILVLCLIGAWGVCKRIYELIYNIGDYLFDLQTLKEIRRLRKENEKSEHILKGEGKDEE